MRDTAREWRRGAAWALGLILLAVAIAFAIRGVQWSALRQANPFDVALLAAAVLGNLVLTAALFWGVTLSFDARPRVSLWTMLKLIAVSGLLNYVPVVRPGLWARAAYLKAEHALPLRQSVLILGVILALAVAVLGAATAVLIGLDEPAQTWVGLVTLAGLTLAAGPIARALLRRRTIAAWVWVPLRAADWAVAAARLWLAFAIVGEPIGYERALLAAAAALVIKLIGLTPNGLGLSEWAVAAVTAAASPVSAASGAAAALIDRAVEVVVMTAAGGFAAWGLSRRSEA